MITLTQTERLVRKIAEAVGQPVSDTQTAKLAQDYANLCRDASRRLEQCAIMIEAGQFLQALQLAETAPPLLDLITVLSFRQATEWRAYCQGHQLPWTEPFYDKYVRLLNSAYNKGIEANHPFYRDYRRAVMDNDDDRAISILRVIARMNPSDENTKEELKRLEEKLLRIRLENLRQILATGDSAAAQALLSQIEASGLPVPSAHPVWQQAQLGRCQQMLRRAEGLREQDAWQDAETLVEEIHAFATHFNLQMPAADADSWTALESWTVEKRAAYADGQDFQRAVSALQYEADTIEAMQRTNPRPSVTEAASLCNSLTAKWREAERFNRPLDEALAERCRQSSDWLQQRMKTADRRKRMLSVVVTLLVLAALGAAVPSVRDWFQQRDLLRRLDSLEASRLVADTEALMNAAPPRLKTKPPVAEGLTKAQSFLAREMELKRAFDLSLTGLQQLATAGFPGNTAPPAALRMQCKQALGKLAPEYQSAGKNALLAWDAKWQPVRDAALGTLLGRAEQIAAGLQGTNGYDAVHAALPGLQSALAAMTPWQTEPPALDSNLRGRFLQVSNQFALWQGKAQQWEKAQAALLGAPTLEEYLSCLAQLVLSPFASAAQRDGVAEIERRKIDQSTFLGELLLPTNRLEWASLTNAAAWPTALMPEQPTQQEKDIYISLRDDKNMQDVHAYQLVADSRPNNSYLTHPIFVQGSISNEDILHRSGLVYDPSVSPETVRFVPQTYYNNNYSDVKKLFRLQECDTFERLGLGDLVDLNTGHYQKPILPLLDQLNHEENASAVFRAYVTLKLFALAAPRPAEWGLRWSPDAPRRLQALTELGAMNLKSGDWMVRAKLAKYEEPLKKYFDTAGAISLEKQAKFLQQLVRQTCLTGFSFAGYCDADGRPVLRSVNSRAADYWGWSKVGPSAVLLLRKSSAGDAKIAEPLPFTPLFVFNGDLQEVLNNATRDSAFPPSQMAAILPPLFTQSHE